MTDLDPKALKAASGALIGVTSDSGLDPERAKRYAQECIALYLAALPSSPTVVPSGWKGHAIPVKCPFPEYGAAGAPIAYDVDPGQGAARNRLVRDWPSPEQADYLRIHDGEITPLFPLAAPPPPLLDGADREGFVAGVEAAAKWHEQQAESYRVPGGSGGRANQHEHYAERIRSLKESR